MRLKSAFGPIRGTLLLAVLAILAFTAPGSAQPSLDSLKRCVERSGLGQTSSFRMRQVILRDGQPARTFQAECRLANRGEKLMIRFDDPPDMANVKLLFKDWGKQLWTYFPSTNRVRKMAGATSTQPIGSFGFSYNDLIPFLNDSSYAFKVLDDQAAGGRGYHRLEVRYGTRQSSLYRKSELRIDAADCTLHEALLFGDGDRLLKTIRFQDYRTVKNRLVPSKIRLTQPDLGEQADITLLAIEFDKDYGPVFFTERGLKQ